MPIESLEEFGNRWRDRALEAELEVKRLQADTARLLELVSDFLDPDPCHYDHHGYCQAHGWFATDPACPHARARKILPPDAASTTEK